MRQIATNGPLPNQPCAVPTKHYSMYCFFSEPGQFEFEKPSFLIKESIGVAKIPIRRNNGTDGACSLSWKAIFICNRSSSREEQSGNLR